MGRRREAGDQTFGRRKRSFAESALMAVVGMKAPVTLSEQASIRTLSKIYFRKPVSSRGIHRMAVGIRTQDLRKVYSSAPPLGAGGGFIARADAKGGKQAKSEIPALDGLSLEVLPAEIFGLLGPNGAGKSTTVGVLTTRVRPTSGQAWIGEHDVWKEQVRVKY